MVASGSRGVFALLYCVTVRVTYAQRVDFFSWDFNSLAGWTVEETGSSYSINSGCTLDPNDPPCYETVGGGEISRVVSTVGWKDIRMRVDVRDQDSDTNADCYVGYASASRSKQTYITFPTVAFQIPIPDNDGYNNQASFTVYLGSNQISASEYCQFDRFVLNGIASTLPPTESPTDYPSPLPTYAPTPLPSATPTDAPLETLPPTNVPTLIPTKVPTLIPSKVPSVIPTKVPTSVPTLIPTLSPTSTPSANPVVTMTDASSSPTRFPSEPPTYPATTQQSESTSTATTLPLASTTDKQSNTGEQETDPEIPDTDQDTNDDVDGSIFNSPVSSMNIIYVLIGGALIGGCIVCVICGLIAICCCRNQRTKRKPSYTEQNRNAVQLGHTAMITQTNERHPMARPMDERNEVRVRIVTNRANHLQSQQPAIIRVHSNESDSVEWDGAYDKVKRKHVTTTKSKGATKTRTAKGEEQSSSDEIQDVGVYVARIEHTYDEDEPPTIEGGKEM